MNTKTVGFLVLSAVNENMILCADGEFRWKGIVGPNGYRAKVYKTESGARKSWPDNPIRPLAE